MPGPRQRGRQDARPFDATTKHLLESDPAAWLHFVGLPTGAPVTAVDADVSTVIAAADKVLRVEDAAPWLAQVELQARYDPSLPVRLLHYNVSLHRRHGLPVASAIVLLRPEADGPAVSGALDLSWSGAPYLSFAYRVVRTWEQPVEAILAGGLGTLPLAPIADVPPEALPGVLRRMGERLAAEAAPGEAATLWAAAFILARLRYPPEVTHMIRSLAQAMRESPAYQEILDEGRAEEARRILLRLGTRRLGPPDADTTAALGALSDVERLERMTERLLDATGWDEVLATP